VAEAEVGSLTKRMSASQHRHRARRSQQRVDRRPKRFPKAVARWVDAAAARPDRWTEPAGVCFSAPGAAGLLVHPESWLRIRPLWNDASSPRLALVAVLLRLVRTAPAAKQADQVWRPFAGAPPILPSVLFASLHSLL